MPIRTRLAWNGKPITYATSPEIGYLPEERGLYPKMKVEDDLFLAQLRGMGETEAKRELRKWLDRFEVPHYVNKKV